MSQSVKLGSYLRITNHLVQKVGGGIMSCPPFIKFLLVGILNTVVGLSMMLLLNKGLSWPYWHATFTGNTTGALVSYLLNKTFTFKSKVTIQAGVPKFVIVVLATYFISFSLSQRITETMSPLITFMRMETDTIAILLGSIIYTITNYMGQKTIVFREGYPENSP